MIRGVLTVLLLLRKSMYLRIPTSSGLLSSLCSMHLDKAVVYLSVCKTDLTVRYPPEFVTYDQARRHLDWEVR